MVAGRAILYFSMASYPSSHSHHVLYVGILDDTNQPTMPRDFLRTHRRVLFWSSTRSVQKPTMVSFTVLVQKQEPLELVN